MSTLTAYGSSIKTLEDRGDRLRIGGYLVLFGSPEEHDATGQRDYFSRETDFDIPVSGATSTVYYHHGMNPTLKSRPLGKARLELRDAGVWMEAELQARDEYEAKIQELVRLGKLGLSSGTASHLVQRTERKNAYGETVHHIDRWPLGLDASLTPTPGEPRTAAICLKYLEVAQPTNTDILFEYVRVQAALSGVYHVGGDVAPWDVKAGLWDESRHPRDERGRWTSGIASAQQRALGTTSMHRRLPSIRLGSLSEAIVDALIPAQPHRFTAQGIPVVNGIKFRRNTRQYTIIFHILNAIHGDGNLPPISLRKVRSLKDDGKEVEGYFEPLPAKGKPHMVISGKSASQLLTIVHETAHYLDFYVLPRQFAQDNYATSELTLEWPTQWQPPELQQFHAAVTQSQAWQRLVELSTKTYESAIDLSTGRTIKYYVDPGYLNYLMDPSEVLARAYSQYIAIRCPNQEISLHLRRHIAAEAYHNGATPIGDLSPDSLHYPSQWESSDFEPIAAALDKLFLNCGWMTPASSGVKASMKNTPGRKEDNSQPPITSSEFLANYPGIEELLREPESEQPKKRFRDVLLNKRTPEQRAAFYRENGLNEDGTDPNDPDDDELDDDN